MQYIGGKKRIAKQIANYINQFSWTLNYYEPFCGSMSIVPHLKTFKSYRCSDIHEDLILMFQALQQGWIPPSQVSEEEYQAIKLQKPSPLRGFVGFGCSFSGKWFGGYARNKRMDDYVGQAKNSLLKDLSYYEKCLFKHTSYEHINPINAIIYCDIPYQNTTKYSYLAEPFDYEKFWNIARKWSENNIVLVSEYSAPEDFECVLEIKTRTDMRTKEKVVSPRIEKLFRYVN